MFSLIKPLWEIDDEDEDDEESSGCSSDSDYEALFSNAPLVKISLADLQKLSEESQRSFEAAEEEPPAEAPQRLPKKGTTPEQILASILEESRKEELKEAKMRRKTGMKMTLPPFQGTRALREEEEGRGEGNKPQQLDSDLPQLNHRTMDETLSRQRNVEREIGESSDEDEEDDTSGAGKALPDKPEDEPEALTKPPEKVAPSAHHRAASSTEEEEEEDQGEKQASSQPFFKPKEDVEQQRKDNIRRLAAIQQRQEEAEGHRKVIQSALAKLVSLER